MPLSPNMAATMAQAEERLVARKMAQPTTTAMKVRAPASKVARRVRARGARGADFLPPVIDDEVEPVEAAPEDEGPTGAMPEAADEHGEEEIDVAAGGAFAIAAEGM